MRDKLGEIQSIPMFTKFTEETFFVLIFYVKYCNLYCLLPLAALLIFFHLSLRSSLIMKQTLYQVFRGDRSICIHSE